MLAPIATSDSQWLLERVPFALAGSVTLLSASAGPASPVLTRTYTFRSLIYPSHATRTR